MILNNRTGDDPRFKEPIIAELYGKFITYLEEQGLTNGKEFKGTIQETFSCSKRYIHIWDMDKTRNEQMVVYLCSTQMILQFGIGNKKEKKTTYKNSIEDLRYKISDGEQAELIDSHQEKVKELFEDFKKRFQKMKESKK